MGLINQAIEKRLMSLKDFEEMMDNDYIGQEAKAGVNVNEHNAFKTSAVYACVRILSFSIASLPFFVFRELDRGKEKAKNHPIYKLIHDQPNSEMTSFTYRSTSMAHVTTWGNAYSEIETDRNGNPVALWPLPPWKVEVRRTKNKKEIFYRVEIDKNKDTGKIKYKNIPAYRILHFMGLSTNGTKGMSVIGAARESIGLGLAAEEYGARFFGSGTNVGGFVSHPQALKDTTVKRLQKELDNKYQGLGRSHRLMFLDEGMKYERVGIPPEDAQFLATRKFQLTDIARFYNVPLHLLQEHENSTTWGSGLEELNIGFVIFSLRPYLVNIEQEIKRKLFVDDNDYFAEHSVEGLLRGDTKARAEFYNKLFQMAAISPNEIREFENRNPYEGGDEYYIQLNMVPVREALTETEVEDIENSRSIEERKTKFKELRLKRSATARHRIAKSYERVFRQASSRIVNREKADIMRKAEKIFQSENKRANPSELLMFEEFLEEFFANHPAYMERQIKPSLTALAEAIQSEAAKEVNFEEGLTDEMNSFIGAYMEKYSERHISSSKGQLVHVAEKSLEEDDNIIVALRNRFEEWSEKRPAKEALRETVQLSNAIALVTYSAAGVRYKKWFAIGADTCEFCQEMDGKTVGIDQDFVGKDDKLDAEGREGEEMIIYRPIGHPQLHESCVCQVLPE